MGGRAGCECGAKVGQRREQPAAPCMQQLDSGARRAGAPRVDRRSRLIVLKLKARDEAGVLGETLGERLQKAVARCRR